MKTWFQQSKADSTASVRPARRVGGTPFTAKEMAGPIVPTRVTGKHNGDDVEIKVETATKEFGGAKFHSTELETTLALSRIPFHQIINDAIKLGPHFYSRVAIARQNPTTKDCIFFADKLKVTADDVAAVTDLLRNQGFHLAKEGPQGYWAASSLVMALSQGHIDSNGLSVERSIANDPARNALLASFTDIIAWAYANNADDIDFAVDLYSPNGKSQICFKIGGRYIRPEMYLLPTDTLVQMLGIAYQKSSGGASAQFEIKSEQQAKIELDLPKSERLPNGARVRLRWSGMANDKGTTVTLRLQRLGDSAKIRSLESAGYPTSQMDILRRVIHSEGGMVVFSGVVGSGKSTSLAQLLSMLPKDIKMISIEDPVELEIPYMYQKTVTRDLNATGDDPAFASAIRAIFRSALDVLLLGEIRDRQTGLLARQVTESGHSVYTTTHAKGALGVIDRFVSPAIGMPRDVLATPDIIKVLVYQALLPTTCPHCAKSPADYASAFNLKDSQLSEHHAYFDRLHRLYNIDAAKFRLRDPHGCDHCRKRELPELNGFSGRTVVSEMIEPDEQMLMHIQVGNNVELTRYWRSLATPSFEDDNLVGKTAMECAVFKASKGVIDPREIEPRFMSFSTVEEKRRDRARHAPANTQ